MKSKITIFMVVSMFLFSGLMAQDFTRALEIPVPETDLNNGGTGNMISGVDFDGDGLLEIYLVNDNWGDTPTELVPRIYKLEQSAADNYTDWPVVWQATSNIPKQNTWPALEAYDMDGDGKMEIYWGIVNNTGDDNLNPARITVFEVAGDGSDVLGIDDGSGNYLPNAEYTITDEDNVNLRPTRFVFADPDDDGTTEIIFSDRKGNDNGYYFGVVSVDNIPDNGDGSETWTLEVSGLDFGLQALPTENKWDVAVIGNNIYVFCEVEITKISWDGSQWNYTALDPLAGGISFITAQVVDLDEDGTMEIIAGEYAFGEDVTRIVLLQEEADTLKHTALASLESSERLIGGAHGDLDQDGYLDFVFGTRFGAPNAAIYRLAFKSGDITDPNNYELSEIDSEYAESGIWSVINISNVDADDAPEVLYTSSTPAGGLFGGTQPIIVLDYTGGAAVEFSDLIVAPEVLLNGETPSGLLFKPGRILDDGNTIWFVGVDGNNKQTYVFRSVDGGATFTHNANPIEGRASQMDAWDENTAVVALANGKIYKTEDGGVTWNEKYSYMINVIATGWFDGCRVLNDNVAVAFGDFEPNGNMHFVRTEDQGENWTEITGIDFMNAAYGYYTWGLASCNVGESIWCCATTMEYDSSFVFRSYDAGVTWESFKIPTDVIETYPRSIVFIDDNNGMIADRQGHLVKTTDGGATWMKVDNPDTSASSWVNGVVWIPNTNIIVGMDDIGVYYTTDLGATWGEINTPPETDSDYIVSGLFGSTDLGFVFTDNGLVLRFEDQLIGVEKYISDNVPVKFDLQQNYPNPFNPVTNIVYEVPAQQHVSLKVYNLMGREVKTLVNGVMNSGSHLVQWDGTDNFGNKVTSGMYLYTLRFNNKVVSKRMTMLK